MASKTGIDFIINGKDMASNAMQSVAKSLNRLQAAFVAYQELSFPKRLSTSQQGYDDQTAAVKRLTNALAIRVRQQHRLRCKRWRKTLRS